MKAGIIGANGNLGRKIVKYALAEKMEVITFVRSAKEIEGVEVIVKDLFSLKLEDIEDIDVLISAFGSGFQADPIINKQAFEQYIRLLDHSTKKLVAIGGAGSLYTDDSHTMFEYELESHPSKLKEISQNIRRGIDEIKQISTFDWTIVCPARFFDLNGKRTGKVVVGLNEEILLDEEGKSMVTYEDLAETMVKIAKDRLYPNKVVTMITQNEKG